MKKIIYSLILLALLFGAISILAQDNDLPSPGIVPDSPFYFLKTWKEAIQNFFTFGAENKAKQFLHLADVRLAEYQKMIEKGKTEIAQRTLDKYEKQLNHALQKIEELKQKGKDTKDISQKAEDATNKHIEVLQRNLEKAPEAAKRGLENAIENSSKVLEKIGGKTKKERSCLNSGGTVSTSSCCQATSDFPSTCLIGACGCSPTDSHQVKVCDCGEGKCFDGAKCVSQETPGDETTNWKTYRNEEYGYQIKYPKDWIIQKNILGAFDIYKSFYDYNCSVEVYADTLEYLYPIEEAEGYFQPFSESKISTKEEVAFIRDISGKKLLSPELAGREIYFFKEEVKNLVGRSQYYYFNIFLDVYKQDPHGEPIIKENKCKDVFKEILSTFQFTKEKTIVDRIPDATCVYRKGEYEMRFYDLQGRMTGIKDGEIKEEIPGSYYIPRDLNSPLDCPPNCYKIGIPDYVSIHKVEIFGIKEGNYKVVSNAIIPAREEPVTFSAINIPIISGLTHVYIVEWEILARSEEGVVIFIDLDGDGIFEKFITSDKILSCEEFIIQLKKS